MSKKLEERSRTKCSASKHTIPPEANPKSPMDKGERLSLSTADTTAMTADLRSHMVSDNNSEIIGRGLPSRMRPVTQSKL
jgi:hypothetical protein